MMIAAATSTCRWLQNFHNSFAAREYWKENTIDLEGIQFTGPVAIHSFPDASNQRSQLCAVIVRNHRTRGPSLRQPTKRLTKRSRPTAPPALVLHSAA